MRQRIVGGAIIAVANPVVIGDTCANRIVESGLLFDVHIIIVVSIVGIVVIAARAINDTTIRLRHFVLETNNTRITYPWPPPIMLPLLIELMSGHML